MGCKKCNKASADVSVNYRKLRDTNIYFKSKFSRIFVFCIIVLISPLLGILMNYFVYQAFFGKNNSFEENIPKENDPKEKENSNEGVISNEEQGSKDKG